MIILVELILTAVVWRRGWGGQAFLPLGVVLGVGVAIGGLSIATGVAFDGMVWLGLPFDVACITALLAMIRMAPASSVAQARAAAAVPMRVARST